MREIKTPSWQMEHTKMYLWNDNLLSWKVLRAWLSSIEHEGFTNLE